ncbi:craniofacial development protein 2-like [Malaya genurostris]|uniref:craniofacial development protein 2-like n=1 Tax=Malaya genurostris TaxID=325434 RepID=UPI0026F38849|nr:craniofacial development protein 2-like [Malaya genurostris]
MLPITVEFGGFLLSAQANAAHIKWELIKERIIVARFRTRVRNLTIIQCYAPTDAAELLYKENFYSKLDAVVDKIPKGEIKIYTGDFNAKIGSDNVDYERVMGRHGLGDMSDIGELFAEFCGNYDMVVGGSHFPHRPTHKATWVSRDGHTENQIDHICISRKWRWSLLDVRNKRSADIASDHHLLIGEIRLRIARVMRQEERLGRRFNTRRLEDPAVKRSFVEELKTRAAGIPEGGSVEEQFMAFKNAFTETCQNNLGELRARRKEWITDDTWQKIEERRDAKAAIDRARTREAKRQARQKYSALSKEVKRSCRRDKRAWVDSLADEGEKAATTGDIRLLHDISRRGRGWSAANLPH